MCSQGGECDAKRGQCPARLWRPLISLSRVGDCRPMDSCDINLLIWACLTFNRPVRCASQSTSVSHVPQLAMSQTVTAGSSCSAADTKLNAVRICVFAWCWGALHLGPRPQLRSSMRTKILLTRPLSRRAFLKAEELREEFKAPPTVRLTLLPSCCKRRGASRSRCEACYHIMPVASWYTGDLVRELSPAFPSKDKFLCAPACFKGLTIGSSNR